MSNQKNSPNRSTGPRGPRSEIEPANGSASQPMPFHHPLLERHLALLAIRLLIRERNGDVHVGTPARD
jgi:hypothetical protein